MEGRKRSEVMNGTNDLLEKMDQAASIFNWMGGWCPNQLRVKILIEEKSAKS